MNREAVVGDVKLTWEVGRFPHAQQMARAAALVPESAPELMSALAQQIRDFSEKNPFQRGVHWNSGQEIAFRHFSWLFASSIALRQSKEWPTIERVIREQLLLGATHTEKIIEYARRAVYNNHLLSEALLLYITGILFPTYPDAARWRDHGRALLNEGCARQFYGDGGYIQLSHNYHRVALHGLIWAVLFARVWGEAPDPCWLIAMEKSADFLFAQQNEEDGRLPNYGANDGALPNQFSTCDYSDFRPVLQAVSALTRGERLYEPGPWDESALWVLGPAVQDLPQRRVGRRSQSFEETGFHVLRSETGASFAAFRCGTIQDRFSQIDMLHVDLWWRGVNVLVDAGSYLYNGPKQWHDHFYETGSHNTVTVDGANQMLHLRRFKNLYRTEARRLAWQVEEGWSTVAGEHLGYARSPGNAVHRRAVLRVSEDLFIVADRVAGEGSHSVRLQWLGAPGPWAHESNGDWRLDTSAGPFFVKVLTQQGTPVDATVVEGQDQPPRGWLARYYAEKIAAPSFAHDSTTSLPWTAISVMSGGGEADVSVDGDRWTVRLSGRVVTFRLADGLFADVSASGEDASR